MRWLNFPRYYSPPHMMLRLHCPPGFNAGELEFLRLLPSAANYKKKKKKAIKKKLFTGCQLGAASESSPATSSEKSRVRGA